VLHYRFLLYFDNCDLIVTVLLIDRTISLIPFILYNGVIGPFLVFLFSTRPIILNKILVVVFISAHEVRVGYLEEVPRHALQPQLGVLKHSLYRLHLLDLLRVLFLLLLLILPIL